MHGNPILFDTYIGVTFPPGARTHTHTHPQKTHKRQRHRQPHIHTCMQSHTHADTHIHTNTHQDKDTHNHTHTDTHTRTHTHTHIHIHRHTNTHRCHLLGLVNDTMTQPPPVPCPLLGARVESPIKTEDSGRFWSGFCLSGLLPASQFSSSLR